MIKRHIYWILVTATMLLLAAGCSADRLTPDLQEEYVEADGVSIKFSALQKGRMRIYVSDEMAGRLEESPLIFMEELSWMGITSVKRTFPREEEFEERTRSCGLHRWYDVEFNKEVPLTKAGDGLMEADGVDAIEYRPKLTRHGEQDTGWRKASDDSYNQLRQLQIDRLPFDDPGMERQWNLFNNISSEYAQAGCDVNVVPAWQEFACGDPEVIVAVVDGGIDFSHEDLAPNMWHNPAQSGDRQYGFNFMDYTYNVTPEDHGTHVAGIIAAANNNGIGCCGIAGGDTKRGVRGVSLMSCQIFKQGSDDAGDDISAIKWAADHGAIICQNSWGYDLETSYIPQATKDVIDYFNTYAGCDKNGNQTAPMAGGLVVFAAGNEFTKSKVYPAAYEDVIAVSALGADYKLATYSNYGEWVDIAAPGGDEIDILSTIINNKYGYSGGTSMAAPHVSGVAALIVANCGGPGFTRDNLIDILLRHTTDISSYNPHKYPGAGLVNAYDAIASDTGRSRLTVTGLEASAQGRRIKAAITARATDSDADYWVTNAIVYCSEYPFSEVEGIPFFRSNIRDYVSHAPFVIESDYLEYDKRYYIAVAVQDEYGHISPASSVTKVETASNIPPEISGPAGPLTINTHETVKLSYIISDPYGDDVTVSMHTDNNDAVNLIGDGEQYSVIIRGTRSLPGTYSFTLTATDSFSMKTELDVSFTVMENHAPELIARIDDMIIGDNSSRKLNLTDYFYDDDGEKLKYIVITDSPSILKTSVYDDTLTVIPQQCGCASITVTASDAMGESAACTFRLLVRDSSHFVELYPNPVVNGKLYIRTGESCTVDMTIMNASGGEIFHQSVQTDPFNPSAVDMSGWDAGAYNVTTTAAGVTETRKIVKL